MSDFFKELNIIDILGICLPGCLLVLLLGGDQTAQLLWAAQFQDHPLAFGIMLIAVGSIAGMLIQELGDMVEKGLWLIPWLDPKRYAACAVNISRIDQAEMDNHKYPLPTGRTADVLKWLCGIVSLLVVICASFLFPVSMWKAACQSNSTAWFGWAACLGLLPLIATAIAARRYTGAYSGKPDDEKRKIDAIRLANPYIQTRLTGHGNTSKRTLFDGWRFAMRNLLWVWAIANLVNLWKPLDLYCRIAGSMMAEGGDMTGNLFRLTLMASIAISLMLVRYYHYAFLRYKYSLEDYMELPANAPAP